MTNTIPTGTQLADLRQLRDKLRNDAIRRAIDMAKAADLAAAAVAKRSVADAEGEFHVAMSAAASAQAWAAVAALLKPSGEKD